MSSNNITVGIDLGDRQHAVCVLSAAGEILTEEFIPITMRVESIGYTSR